MTNQEDAKTGREDLRAVSALIGDALSKAAKLFQNEVDLAKAELTEKAQTMGGAIGYLVGGAILVIPALVMVLFALSAALISAGWSQPLFYLTSAVVAAGIAGLFVAIGINRFDSRKLIPGHAHETLSGIADPSAGKQGYEKAESTLAAALERQPLLLRAVGIAAVA
ncbi:phage holin family protein [Bradyrhizobium elkanii]|uniref:Phage holin family protein n=1 Tax=Bradyrhizobium elkanii TaxID=29448 RepID=A0A4U6RSM5_BRAEL|nr:phage holin family protein [Bradyrhizobium elkanii]